MRCALKLLFVASIALPFVACEDSLDREASSSLFRLKDSIHTRIAFHNTLVDDKNFNIIEYLYYYNGGGVAIGDVNNDGLPDVYFSANQRPNKLYLNKGNLKFEDITDRAGVAGKGNWKTGVSMVDVNSDGLMDIFVCGVGNYKKFNGFNQLYINNGDLTFTDKTTEYGLTFQGFSTQASFFDYDLDGDLDMYLLNHSVHTQRSYGKVSLRYQVDSLAGDRLYKNLFRETGTHKFQDVTKDAGILSSQVGYGLGVAVSDVNNDGFPDIYISNDFIENDYLYINQKDGTFVQQLEKVMPHSSRFSMGNDIGDINNDLLPDIITVDMLPQDESVIKTSAGEDSYEVYAFKLKYGYHKQVSRNTLQLNLGKIDSAAVSFRDIALAAGVSATDWSWGPLLQDFDGDGYKDLFVSNGIVRRPNDLDYINFISSDSVQRQSDVLPWISKMPEGKVSSYAFRNRGDLTFEDVTAQWGLSRPGFSNGDAIADLDNDGDPDLIVNRINEPAHVYENTSQPGSFVKIRLKGDSTSGNINGIGAKVLVSFDSTTQMQELFPVRGWCSSSDFALMFGLSGTKKANVKVIWPDNRVTEKNVSGKEVLVSYKEATKQNTTPSKPKSLFEATDGPAFIHRENEFNAFNRESLIPHMLTTEGPCVATGDINGDGMDDAFIGGAKGQRGELFLQDRSGSFIRKDIASFKLHQDAEDVAAAFFDSDKDGDLDLIVVSGGQEELERTELLNPRLYINDGKGNLSYDKSRLPAIALQGSCVKPADYDGDGDQDLFIGSSVMPMLYGMAPVSYLLINDGTGNFLVNSGWLGASTFDNPSRNRPGMVKDATWVDVNKDGLLDLVLVGEWMPITILIQQKDHRFLNMTQQYGTSNTKGWWSSVTAVDIDNDGDEDLIAGNVGLNSRLKASSEKPLTMYLGDFDSNGGSDHILVYYNGDKSYPFTSRDQLVKQLPALKKKFLNYYDYRNVLLDDIVTPQLQGNSAVMQATEFASLVLLNNRDKFIVRQLPMEAQMFPVYSILADDVNSDGHQDLMLCGNLTAVQPEIGPYDAGVGLVLMGDGSGSFDAVAPRHSGFIVTGEGRDIRKVNSNGQKLYLVGRNNNSVLAFKKR